MPAILADFVLLFRGEVFGLPVRLVWGRGPAAVAKRGWKKPCDGLHSYRGC